MLLSSCEGESPLALKEALHATALFAQATSALVVVLTSTPGCVFESDRDVISDVPGWGALDNRWSKSNEDLMTLAASAVIS